MVRRLRPLLPLCVSGLCVLLLVPVFLTGPVAADGAAGKAIDEHFKGKVVSYERGVLTLRYDFSSPEQLGDWFKGVPFPIFRIETPKVEVADGRLVITGSTGMTHNADWLGDITVKSKLTLNATRDVGGMLSPTTETNDFATFTVREFYFHAWDTGQQGGQNSIIKFGDQWREADATDEYIGFRYVIRKKAPDRLAEGSTIPFEFGITRKKLYAEFPGAKLKGKDYGVELTSSRPGFYAIKKGVKIDDVVITGKLDPAWMATHGVEPRLSTDPE